MFAVIFDVYPKPERYDDYLALAGMLRPDLEGLDGFVSIYVQGKVLSRSSWRDETAARAWQAHVLAHVSSRARAAGPTVRARLRVVAIERDYGMFERAQAPQ